METLGDRMRHESYEASTTEEVSKRRLHIPTDRTLDDFFEAFETRDVEFISIKLAVR